MFCCVLELGSVLIVGDSNVRRLSDLVGSRREKVDFCSKSGASWDDRGSFVWDYSEQNPNSRYCFIAVYLGVNDIYRSTLDGDQLTDAIMDFAIAFDNLFPMDVQQECYVCVVLPHVVFIDDQDLNHRSTLFQHSLNEAISLINSASESQFRYRWFSVSLNDISQSRLSLILDHYPNKKHLSPYGLSLFAMAVNAAIDTKSETLQHLEFQLHDIWPDDDAGISLRYSNCHFLYVHRDRTSRFQTLYPQSPSMRPSSVAVVSAVQLYRALFCASDPSISEDEGAYRWQLCLFFRKILPSKYSNKITNAITKNRQNPKVPNEPLEMLAVQDAFSKQTSRLGKSSSFCVVCMYEIDPFNNYPHLHVTNKAHIRARVLALYVKLGDALAVGSLVDRLAINTVYDSRPSSNGLQGERTFAHDCLPGDVVLQMRATVALDPNSTGVYTDVVRCANLYMLLLQISNKQYTDHDGTVPLVVTVQILGGVKKNAVRQGNLSATVMAGFSFTESDSCTHFDSYSCAQSSQDAATEWMSVDIPCSGEVVSLNSFTFSLELPVGRHCGGLFYDVLETWAAVAFPTQKFTVPITNVTIPAFGCVVNLFLGHLVVDAYVFDLAEIVLCEDAGEFANVRKQAAPADSTDWQMSSAEPDSSEGEPDLFKMSLSAFASKPSRTHRMLRRGSDLFNRYLEQRCLDDRYAETMDGPLTITLASIDGSNYQKLLFDLKSRFTPQCVLQPRQSAVLDKLPPDRVVNAVNFWAFLDQLLVVSMHESDFSEHYKWLTLEDIKDQETPDGDVCTRIRVKRPKSNIPWFRDVPSYLLLKLTINKTTLMFSAAVLRYELPATSYFGHFDVEYLAGLAEGQQQKRDVMARKEQVEICKSRPRYMITRIVNDLQSLLMTDKELLGELLHVIKTSERKGWKEFRDYYSINLVPAEMLEGLTTKRYRGMPSPAMVQDYAGKVEMQMMMRNRFLSMVESMFPGASLSVGFLDRLLAVDSKVHDALGDARETVVSQYNKNLHAFFVGSLMENNFCEQQGLRDVCALSNGTCDCKFGASDFAEVILQQIRRGERVIVMEGPVGCGKTYSLCQTIKHLMGFLESFNGPNGDIRGVRNVEHLNFADSTIFVLSTTNSNVETTKEYLANMVDPSKILHLHSQLYSPEAVDGVQNAICISTRQESKMPGAHCLRNLVNDVQVVVSTVDLAVSYLSRLRLIRNVYIFLDEAAQVGIKQGLYLSMFCDTFVMFGDVYQTEPYLDVGSQPMKAFGMTESIMEFTLKCKRARGMEEAHKCVFRTNYNWRSSAPTVRYISRIFYSDEEELIAMREEECRETIERIKYRLPLFRQLIHNGTNKWDAAIVPIVGSMCTTKAGSHFNVDEAVAVVSMIRSINNDYDFLDDNDKKTFKVGVVSLYAAMTKLLEQCCEFTLGRIPPWLRIVSARVAQGCTYTYVILPLIESGFFDALAGGETRQAFTSDYRQFTVALSRHRLGLIIVGNPFRFMYDNESPVCRVMQTLAHSAIFHGDRNVMSYLEREFSASFPTFTTWQLQLAFRLTGESFKQRSQIAHDMTKALDIELRLPEQTVMEQVRQTSESSGSSAKRRQSQKSAAATAAYVGSDSIRATGVRQRSVSRWDSGSGRDDVLQSQRQRSYRQDASRGPGHLGRLSRRSSYSSSRGTPYTEQPLGSSTHSIERHDVPTSFIGAQGQTSQHHLHYAAVGTSEWDSSVVGTSSRSFGQGPSGVESGHQLHGVASVSSVRAHGSSGVDTGRQLRDVASISGVRDQRDQATVELATPVYVSLRAVSVASSTQLHNVAGTFQPTTPLYSTQQAGPPPSISQLPSDYGPETQDPATPAQFVHRAASAVSTFPLASAPMSYSHQPPTAIVTSSGQSIPGRGRARVPPATSMPLGQQASPMPFARSRGRSRIPPVVDPSQLPMDIRLVPIRAADASQVRQTLANWERGGRRGSVPTIPSVPASQLRPGDLAIAVPVSVETAIIPSITLGAIPRRPQLSLVSHPLRPGLGQPSQSMGPRLAQPSQPLDPRFGNVSPWQRPQSHRPGGLGRVRLPPGPSDLHPTFLSDYDTSYDDSFYTARD